jgi:hypothetical protein
VLRFSNDSGRELRSFAPFQGLWFMLHDATQGSRPGLHLCRPLRGWEGIFTVSHAVGEKEHLDYPRPGLRSHAPSGAGGRAVG